MTTLGLGGTNKQAALKSFLELSEKGPVQARVCWSQGGTLSDAFGCKGGSYEQVQQLRGLRLRVRKALPMCLFIILASSETATAHCRKGVISNLRSGRAPRAHRKKTSERLGASNSCNPQGYTRAL